VPRLPWHPLVDRAQRVARLALHDLPPAGRCDQAGEAAAAVVGACALETKDEVADCHALD
jgi:hypothetical protein